MPGSAQYSLNPTIGSAAFKQHSDATAGKLLSAADESGEAFQAKVLGGRPGVSVNFDTMFHTDEGWQMIELLRDAREGSSNDPHSSHPTRYWDKNWRKFAALWAVRNALPSATLWLVNYSLVNDHIKVMRVDNVRPGPEGGLDAKEWRTEFNSFQKWYLSKFVDKTIPPW